ncbi:hypothetical protein A2V49_04175 [candidate division WWE3 bacterium RBG_19FT_COMBO_34_6]|uniref:Putative gluconeogenesis factor n=1 Tax=candidate division WWE3 bacterium RBG_19FT_COMBO_34_6 TaxID=1802612 RepID=A0A1F4UM61_UNCKA|nr:MAG: hypothetical protein A2V49_04175 [candidate division WWE3 bacterium RBG_19FT_COMBO_34_6]
MHKVVVIGGGTGTYTVLSGLKKKNLDLTSIVTVADSGGSTGRLRDEFGYLPLGGFRMALVALADANGDSNILRDLFSYRFDKGTGLIGHNFGNLLLTALSDILGNEEKAFEYASKILRVKGKVVPITNKDITLIAEYENGEIIIGETHIDEPHSKHDGTQKIKLLRGQPKATISKKAKDAIKEADLIVVGPGDLYTSILANFVVSGVSQAVKDSKAKFVHVVNLMNRYGHTHNFKASDYIDEITRYVGRLPDFVLINNSKLPRNILKRYEEEKGYPVKDNLTSKSKFKIIRKNLLAPECIKKVSGDAVRRSLIRHDSDKLAKEIEKILTNYISK